MEEAPAAEEAIAAEEAVAAEEAGNTEHYLQEVTRMVEEEIAAVLNNIISKCRKTGVAKDSCFVPAKPFFAGGAMLC